LRRLRQFAEFGEVVGHGLVAEQVGELREDARGQRYVSGFDLDARGAGIGLHDRQERGGGEERRLVGEGVEDLVGVGHGSGRGGKAAIVAHVRDGPRSAFYPLPEQGTIAPVGGKAVKRAVESGAMRRVHRSPHRRGVPAGNDLNAGSFWTRAGSAAILGG